MNKKIKYIPESIRVAGHNLIVEKYGLDTAVVGGLYGAFHAMRGKILICDELDKISCLDTLIHELGHAIFFFYGLAEDSDEETVVNQMGIGWAQIWVDNPALVKFLNYAVR